MKIQLVRLWSLCVMLACGAGCLKPTPANGALTCNHNGKACPDGYYCAANNSCWKTGSAPSGTLDMGGSGDMLPGMPDLAPPGNPLASACTMDAQCASRHCADGVCCDTACTGQCEACNGNGTVGTCSAVTGASHHTPCTGAAGGDSCAGTCDGTTRATCTYPSASTVCGAACNSHCDGAGTCPSGNGACPNGFACGMSTCKTSCSSNSDCQPNFACTAPNCVRVPETDCLDGVDNNGDGLIDCADPTCVGSQVQCVPNVNGAAIGYLSTAACAANFTATHLNQSLTVPNTCSGCGCSVAAHCGYTIVGDSTGAGCFGNSGTLTTFTAVGTHTTNLITSYSVKINGSATVDSCSGTGTGTPDATRYATSNNFCAALISPSTAGCGANQVCAPVQPGSAHLCSRLGGSTCPGTYNASSATWYLDGKPNDTRSCSCGCSGPNASGCPGNIEMQVYTNQACAADGHDCHYCESSCCPYGTTAHTNYYFSVYDNSFGGDHQVNAIKINSIETPSVSCTGAGSVSGGSASADPTLATLVCCQ